MSLKSPRPMWKGVVIGFIAPFALLVLFNIPALFRYNELDSNSLEGIEARSLRMERYDWLADGCPQPPVAAKYMGAGPGDTNYTYTGTLTATNFLGGANNIFHGLFATKFQNSTRTLVITTSGDIFAVEDSGQVRLVEWMDYEGRLTKWKGE